MPCMVTIIDQQRITYITNSSSPVVQVYNRYFISIWWVRLMLVVSMYGNAPAFHYKLVVGS